MTLKIKLVLIIVLMLNISLAAQNDYTVKGSVVSKSDNLPIPGAAVIVKESNNGTSTDFDGNFELQVKKGDILQVSYLGYISQLITINSQTKITISLVVDTNELDEVVVIGYGTQKKANLTGSISKVTNKTLDQIPVARVDDALIGQVAGVNIQMTNPAAGEAPSIRIRGQGSISFESNPLIVVDGIAVGNDADYLSSIDMNDVESLEVLKDASSSSIYGSRGANGIIMITTKRGREGPVKFSYNTYLGVKSVPDSEQLTTVKDWTEFVLANNGGVMTDRLTYINLLGGDNTNWEEVMMDGGIIQSHNLSIRGGTRNTKFNASLGYLDDEGVLLTDNFEKINLRLRVDSKIRENVKMGVSINTSLTEQRKFPLRSQDAIRQSPWTPLYLTEENIQFVNRFRENGRWADAQVGDYAVERMFDDYDLDAGMPVPSGGTDISTTSSTSALAKVLERDYRRYQTKVYANTYLQYNFNDDLYFKQTVAGDYRFTKNTRWLGIQATRNGAGDSKSTRSSSVDYHTILESTLNLNKNIKDHKIVGLLGFAYEYWQREGTSLTGIGYDSDIIQTIPASNLSGGYTYETEEKLASYFARVNYDYNNRYLVSLSVRADGSSKFGPNNKFGFFPAASVGWRISNEKFLADSKVISELKLRTSYGITGSNSGIGRYDYLGLIEPVGTAIDGVGTGYNPINIANDDLKWEKLVEFNPGIDASFFGGVFGLSVDYYIRTSKDLLLYLPVPGVTGFESALVNKGEVKNEGFELELNSRNITRDNFTWTTTGLLSRNKNTLVDFAGSDGLISSVDPKRPSEWIALEGQPLSTFYGYVTSDQEIDLEYLRNPFYPINANAQDTYVKDLNGDGIIDTDDRTVLGDPYPDFVWSLTNNLKYKNLDLSFMFQGSHGAEVRNIDQQYINNQFTSNMDYISTFPDKDLVVQKIFTDRIIMDASYVALRNVNFGYQFNRELIEKLNMRKLRIYVAAQNLLYIKGNGYVGFNPEGINEGFRNPLTYGYQRGASPIYSTISFGLNVEF